MSYIDDDKDQDLEEFDPETLSDEMYSDLYGRRKRKKQNNKISNYELIFITIFATLTVVVLVGGLVFNALRIKGYIHVSTDGSLYVQDQPINDDEGVGNDVMKKLNAMDKILDGFYFGDVDSETARNNIYKAYLAAYGDKYTVYYTPEEYKLMMESTSGIFYGLGAVCQKHEESGAIQVVEPYEDAPGYKAGLRKDDLIFKVDGRDVTNMDLSAGVALIKGEKGTSVELEIKRGSETIIMNIVRDEVKARTVNYEMLENGIGYLDISQFDTVTTDQFKKAVEELQNQGMTGLIIDIRSNPGGVLGGVVDILEYMLPNGLIVYTEDKYGNRKNYSGSDNSEIKVPVVVLVDGNSASASEIFAGVMQDYEKACIIGTQTFGKGIVQTIQPLSDGSAIKYTIAKYFTAKGQDIHGKGVTPDIVVEYDAKSLSADGKMDNQIEAAIKYLSEKK